MVDRRTLGYLSLGLVGILAVALAAPALTTAVSVIDPAPLEPPEPGTIADPLLEEAFATEPAAEPGGLPGRWLAVAAALVGVVFLGRHLLVVRPRPTRLVGLAIAVSAVLVLLAGTRALVRPVAPGVSEPVVLLAVGTALALAAAGAVVLLRHPDDPHHPPPTTPTEDFHPEPAPFGERSVDPPARLGPDAHDNDVYRAWATMAARAGIPPDAAPSPSGVLAAAVAQGLDEPAATALTRLFETVRYGPSGPTREQEHHARALLTRLDPPHQP